MHTYWLVWPINHNRTVFIGQLGSDVNMLMHSEEFYSFHTVPAFVCCFLFRLRVYLNTALLASFEWVLSERFTTEEVFNSEQHSYFHTPVLWQCRWVSFSVHLVDFEWRKWDQWDLSCDIMFARLPWWHGCLPVKVFRSDNTDKHTHGVLLRGFVCCSFSPLRQ